MQLLAAIPTLPFLIEPNQGQAPGEFRAIARHSSVRIGLAPGNVAFLLPRQRVNMRFVGGQATEPRLEGRLESHSNYYGEGLNLARVPHYSRVRYRGVWPGIDVVLYERDRRMEYDFEVAPGADPNQIRLRFDGATRVSLSPAGAVVLETPEGRLEHLAPRLFQPGDSKPVAGRFRRVGQREVAFEVGAYERSRGLVIDPVVKYSSYVGTDLAEYGRAIATGPAGRILVAGVVEPRYLVPDPFVAAFSGTGETLHWLTTLRSPTSDHVMGIAADAAGNAFILGTTGDLEATPGYNPPLTSFGHIFVARLDTAGVVTYLARVGGTPFGYEPVAIAADGAGNVYITGLPSGGYPVTPGAYSSASGSRTAFVTKIDPTGKNILYSTYLPGVTARAITVNGAGEAHITGEAQAEFPAAAGSLSTYCYGSRGFVAKLSSSGSALLSATCLPGPANGIQVDAEGNILVVSSQFQVWKLDATASVMVYNTQIAACDNQYDRSTRLAVDGQGQAFALCSFQGGRPLVARLTAAGQVASYWLGPEQAIAGGIALTAAGYAAITGTVTAAVLTPTPGANDSTLGGYLDAFLMIVDLSDTAKVTHTVTTNPAGLNFTVDGVDYTGSHAFEWPIASEHVVTALSPQTPADGVRHTTKESSVTIKPILGGVATSTQFEFNTFFRINATINPPGAGTFRTYYTPPDSYYSGYSNFPLSPVANSFYRFSHWSGDINSTDPWVGQPLTGPMNVTANFTACNPSFLVPAFVIEPTRMWRTTYHRPDIGAECPWALHFQTPWLTAHEFSGRLALLASTDVGLQPRKATFNLGSQVITVVQKSPSITWRETNGTLRIYPYRNVPAPGKGGAFDGETASTQTLEGDAITAVRDRWGGVWAGVFEAASQTWGTFTFLGGASVGTPAITMAPNGTAYIAIRDLWDSYWVTAFTPGGAVGAWSHMGGVFSTDPAMTATASAVYVVGKDRWNGLWSNRLILGSTWQGWRFGGGIIKGKPAVSGGSDNIAYIAARDNWDAVWLARVNGDTWLEWKPAQGVVDADPQIVSLPDAVRVVSLDASGNIWHREFALPPGQFGSWNQRWAALSDFSACAIHTETFVVGRTKAGAFVHFSSVDTGTGGVSETVAAAPLSCGPR